MAEVTSRADLVTIAQRLDSRELAERGEFSRVSEVLDENWVENCLGLTGWTMGLDIALANLQAGFGQAFSDLRVTEHEVVEDGDALVVRGENTAVHTGRFLGIEPTGKCVSWENLWSLPVATPMSISRPSISTYSARPATGPARLLPSTHRCACSGRTPTITSPGIRSAGMRAPSMVSETPPRLSTSASFFRVALRVAKLIDGLPMKPATNTFSGCSYTARVSPTCSSTPSLITATRSPIVIASTWSCVT